MKKHTVYMLILSLVLFAAAYFMENPYYLSYEKWVSVGDNCLSQNDMEQAEYAYTQALKFDGNGYDGWAGLAYIYNTTQQSDRYRQAHGALLEYGIEEIFIPRILAAYADLPGSSATDIETVDMTGFNYYNENGTLVMHRSDTSNGKNSNYLLTDYSYDESGRVSVEHCKGFQDHREKEITYRYYYDESDRLIKTTKKYYTEETEEKYFYDEDGSLVRSENYMFSSYDKDRQWLNYVNTYENGRLIQQDGYSLNGYPKTVLSYTVLYNNEQKPEKRTCFSEDGSVTCYHLYTYSDRQTTEDQYRPDHKINQRITTTFSPEGKTTVTQLFDNYGQVVKTVTEQQDGSITVERVYDDIINPRPLTEEEIEQVNRHKYTLGIVLYGSSFEYPREKDYSFLAQLVREDWLTVYDKQEINNLLAEGLDIDLERMDSGYRYTKVSYNTAQRLLQKYLGLCCEDYGEELMSRYSVRYDCFYLPIDGDINSYNVRLAFECIGGVVEDNMVKLYSKNRTLYLKPQGDGYIMTACVQEDHSDLLPPQQDYELKVKDVFLTADPAKGTLYNNAVKAYNDFLTSELPTGMIEYEDYNYYSYIERYALYDITRDGLPELFTFINSGGMHKDVYTYKNGQVVQLSDSFGNSYHGPDKVLKCGMVANEHFSTGGTYFFTTYYPDGTTEDVSFSNGWNSEGQMIYWIGRNSVTEEEYIEFAREYMVAWTSEEATMDWYNTYEKVYK